jgi:hypothetical protein
MQHRPLRPVALGAMVALSLPLFVFAPGARSAPASSASTKSSTSATGGAGGGGKLNREEFEEALKAIRKDLFECYDKALKKDAIAEGDVILALTTQGGKIIKADIDKEVSTMKLEDAQKCILGVVKKMKMPLAKNAKGEHDAKVVAEIRYPIEFSLGIEVSSGVSQSTGAKIDYDKVKNTFFVEKVNIGRCYLEAYKAKKGVAAVGKLILKMSVAGGKATTVEEVKPDTTVTDEELKTCVFEAVKKFKFPLAKNPAGKEDEKATAIVVYPLEFKPR